MRGGGGEEEGVEGEKSHYLCLNGHKTSIEKISLFVVSSKEEKGN